MFVRPFFLFFVSISLFTLSNIAAAATLDEVKQAIGEAKALRAAEFAPAHYNSAERTFRQAQELLIQKGDRNKIRSLLDQAAGQAAAASSASQQFTQNFSNLVESRDRLQLAGDEYTRDDITERAEKEFAIVVTAAESGNMKKARKEAVNARRTLNSAQVVAAREQFVRPISKSIAQARKNKARNFAPKALSEAIDLQKKTDALIKSDPDAQTQAYALYQQGYKSAQHATRVASMGSQFTKKPQLLERWVDASDARMETLAKALGIQLDRSQSPDMQLALLKQAIEDMQGEYKAQLADANKQSSELSKKLAKYEGDMARDLKDMADIRYKLQLKREAEAKIKRLTKLFSPDDVEILLTTDADVIFRMKTLNFRSGSAVIPPQAYVLLDNAIKSIEIFPKRSVRIEGHTDYMGGNAFNQALSERRANAVTEYLHQNMPEFSNQMDAVGHGEEKPIANNETAAGRTKNRRIDIILVAPPASTE
ncbi:OmpA-OmpF porin, OOP family [Mariprofundus micogutta]|uniref:OmpA-OmpF porin, OOP family n=1 Tax=Mariprofundus micogutta TaxID=1921010 RepID=A0A1L8CR82_9PROT|nr:OmpA family protein [Mariprofundus micogutta]GAV21418.1 OmpA-OmpF porin, OOP family [Mariprofundus micogutta]